MGDAEDAALRDRPVDRYVSTGSIEYWPDPQRAIAEAYRVLRPGGVACSRARSPQRTRWPARSRTPGCSSPPRTSTVAWFARAGFTSIERLHVAPDWWGPRWDRYAVAIAASSPRAGRPPALPAPEAAGGRVPAPPVRLARFAAGSLAGAAFIPIALWFTLVRKLRR